MQTLESVQNAIQAAELALAQAKAMVGSKDSKAKGSAGRIPSPEQQAAREAIQAAIDDNKIGLFTVKGLSDALGLDRIQCRNAIIHFEQSGLIARYAEKLPEGRGQRELIYKVASFEVRI